MSAAEPSIADRPTVFCLHYLGGSAREWAPVAARLEGLACVAIDLPGFGDAARTPGYSLADMAAFVGRAIRSAAPGRWILVGHSMGAKVAAVVAREAEDGAPGLAGLAGLVLIAGSPPGPEPMPHEQRQTMLSWFAGDADSRRAQAQQYIAANAGADLDVGLADEAVADVLRADRAAWLAWLEKGSLEDWSSRVGILQTPTVVVAGSTDENLGPAAQHDLMAPHFAHVRSVTLAGAKHLLPLERAPEIAGLIEQHVAAVAATARRAQVTSAAYHALIDSDRVSTRTREALVARERPVGPGAEPRALDEAALATLRAVVNRVVPQVGLTPIDLAARIERQLAAGAGDGWRFAALPPDAQAYRAALGTLSEAARTERGQDFTELDGAGQDEMLARVAAGEFRPGSGAVGRPDGLNAAQMRAWFEDLRADTVKTFVAHPATLARMGYSGIANGGDGEHKSGFIAVGVGEREDWEPIAAADAVG